MAASTRSAANVSDSVPRRPTFCTATKGWSVDDAGYQGNGKRLEQRERAVQWQVADATEASGDCSSGRVRSGSKRQRKASVRAKVEHPFQIVKVRFGYAKDPNYSTD